MRRLSTNSLESWARGSASHLEAINEKMFLGHIMYPFLYSQKLCHDIILTYKMSVVPTNFSFIRCIVYMYFGAHTDKGGYHLYSTKKLVLI